MRNATLVFTTAVIGLAGLTGVAALRRPLVADRIAAGSTGYFIDLNRADAAALGLLPGIGPNLARRIVERREREGPFASIDELTRVRGIGPRTLERVRPFVEVRPSGTGATP